MKRFFRSVLVFLCLGLAFSAYGETYHICFGSFKIYSNAVKLVQMMEKDGVHCFISEYHRSADETFYRVLYEETFTDAAQASANKRRILNLPQVRELGIRDSWNVDMEKFEANSTVAQAAMPVVQEQNAPSVQTAAEPTVEQVQEQPLEQTTEQTIEQTIEQTNEQTAQQVQEEQVQVEVPETAPSQNVAEASAVQPEQLVTENEENRVMIIRDSDSGEPVADADVNIDDTWNLHSDSEGAVVLPMDIDDGQHSMTVTKGDEYVPTSSVFNMENGQLTSVPQVSIPKAVDYERVKIILDWGEYPEDLDSHICSPYGHVFYGNKNQADMDLDRDDTTSFGPETVTIQHPLKELIYTYCVFNYSYKDYYDSDSLFNSGCRVRVYFNNRFVKEFYVKDAQFEEEPGIGRTWHVFDVINGNELRIVNRLTNEYPTSRQQDTAGSSSW